MNLSKFAERLSDVMFEAKIGARELANKLGCDVRTINRYLHCDREPTVEMLVLLADYFRCSSDFLLGVENENYSSRFNVCPPFKDRLPELLKQCEISQYGLGKLAKISYSTLVCWKNGTKQPTVRSIVSIARALGKTVDFVLGRTN